MNLTIFVAMCVLADATYSMLQYRRHIQVYNPELMEDLELPLDIKVEAFLGMILGIFSAIIKYSLNFGNIRLETVLAEKNKTYEFSNNINRAYTTRNLQRTRGGAIFSKKFPSAQSILNKNKELNNLVARQF